MNYVDGFIVAVKKDKMDDYRKLAELASGIWKEYGAIDYVEAVADDVSVGELTSFPRAVKLEEDEVVIFSYITYPSREVRDACMKNVMEDERMKGNMDDMPFDGKRMIYGGFKIIVQA
ncbi:MAG: DUF1428 domain-containing protein [Sphingomonadales bacterium]|nr:MAG: DUF1428 domain-containing protein [Sphingomonadales bacterium]